MSGKIHLWVGSRIVCSSYVPKYYSFFTHDENEVTCKLCLKYMPKSRTQNKPYSAVERMESNDKR